MASVKNKKFFLLKPNQWPLPWKAHHDIMASCLKNVFCPPACGGIGASFQVLGILEYACYRSDCCAVGLKRGIAAALNQNPIFETAFESYLK